MQTFVISARAINLLHLPPRGGVGASGRLRGRAAPGLERPLYGNPSFQSPCGAITCSFLQQPRRVREGLVSAPSGRGEKKGEGGRLCGSVVEPRRGREERTGECALGEEYT